MGGRSAESVPWRSLRDCSSSELRSEEVDIWGGGGFSAMTSER